MGPNLLNLPIFARDFIRWTYTLVSQLIDVRLRFPGLARFQDFFFGSQLAKENFLLLTSILESNNKTTGTTKINIFFNIYGQPQIRLTIN